MSDKQLNIYVLRHGQSNMNKLHLIQGQKQFPKGTNGLTKKGIKQIESAKKIIDRLGITQIFSSDLERCMETCSIVNRSIKVPVSFAVELREQCCGTWEGKSSKDIFTVKTKELIDKEIEVIPPRGESLKDVSKRVTSFLVNLTKQYQEGNILIVTHGAVIQALLGNYLKVPYRYRFRIKVKAGSIAHIVLKENSFPEIVLSGYN